jgi:hypothetical protein
MIHFFESNGGWCHHMCFSFAILRIEDGGSMPKLHRDACFTIYRYVHLSCFRCRPFIGVRRKAGNAAPVSLHHQTPAGTAGSGKVLVDSGQHSTDSPHLVMYRPWNCD